VTAIPAWVGDRLAPVDKLRVHRQGLRHRAVSVFVVRGADVLLQRRAASKYHTPGLWANACCTHPRWGEAPRDCACRRLREELGIRGLDPEPRGCVEYRADVGGGMVEHEVVDLFVAEAPADLVVMPDPSEVARVSWVPLRALVGECAARPERYTPWLRIYLSHHAERLFGATA
jgi:isopentenyl-diphosphate delta-isomerase